MAMLHRSFLRMATTSAGTRNDASNGVFLPSNRFSPNASGAAVHSQIHTKAYYEAVEDALRSATTRDKATATLDSIRLRLLGGGFP